MADAGPCAEEALSDIGSLNRVFKDRHKFNNNNDDDLVINIDEEACRMPMESVHSCVSVDEKKSDISFRFDIDDVDDDDDDDIDDDDDDDVGDDDDDDEDADDDDDGDEDDDDDEISTASISSGCVSDEVLLAPRTTIVHNNKPVEDTVVVVIHHKNNDGGSLIGNIDTGTIRGGVVIPEPNCKRGAALKSIDKIQRGGSPNGSPFKGQIRTAEDTLVGPCGKKRCVDRYDSSESSDSGVAVSCGECSSSGTSDITEPGSPCSTSSDEGLAGIRSTAPSPPHKLAPPTPPPSRGPQWPWTPPLAATACSTLKKFKGEPEAGALPRAGAADPTTRGKTHHLHHQHDGQNPGTPCTQGKITEYFKTQIKPQQVKVKKSLDMSMLVAKSSPEFRRPLSVQRNKGGLAKYLGARPNDWEPCGLAMSPPPTTKSPIVGKPDNNLPIPGSVLNSLPAVKLSSLRLPSDASPDPKPVPISPVLGPETPTDDGFAKPSKPARQAKTIITNENNNLTPNTLKDDLHLSRIPTLLPVNPKPDDEHPKPVALLSPILSAPTTIRFPAQAPGKNRPQTTDTGICRWDQCDARFDSSGVLLEHLQVSHINTQTGGDNFICHWQGCKVQGRTSCSRRWLERHVLSHGGNKPFRCIVDGCGSRFSSQITLERHVNGHFNQPETSSSSGRKSCENGGKLVRRNGKRLRYRRQPWSARLFDFIDTGVMEGLQHRLLELARTRTQGRLAETPGDAMALTSQVLARRVESDGKTKVLLRWYPQDIVPDEWVPESEVQGTKHVRICSAAATSPDQVNQALYPALNSGTPPQSRTKQRRKPVKNS